MQPHASELNPCFFPRYVTAFLSSRVVLPSPLHPSYPTQANVERKYLAAAAKRPLIPGFLSRRRDSKDAGERERERQRRRETKRERTSTLVNEARRRPDVPRDVHGNFRIISSSPVFSLAAMPIPLVHSPRSIDDHDWPR